MCLIIFEKNYISHPQNELNLPVSTAHKIPKILTATRIYNYIKIKIKNSGAIGIWELKLCRT